MEVNYPFIALIIYSIILLVVYLRILYDTQSSTKAIAYLFLCTFLPVFGILFYLAFGINYWKKKRYSKKMNENEKMLNRLTKKIPGYNNCIVEPKRSFRR
jgi:cardiolipin synthase